jgi:hypothetical protein
VHLRDPANAVDLVRCGEPGYEFADARPMVERHGRVVVDRARTLLRQRFEDDLLRSELAAHVGCSQMQSR